jgi:hypothetical protein
MEYLIGAAITMMAYIITNRLAKKQFPEEESLRITYSQSHVYELTKPYVDMFGPIEENLVTQSQNYIKNVYMKIMIVKDKAYWIKDTRFMVANIVDGQVDKANSAEVDTMSMDRVELDEMLFIVEQLRGDENDSRGSGK